MNCLSKVSSAVKQQIKNRVSALLPFEQQGESQCWHRDWYKGADSEIFMSCQIERYMWEELPQIWFITHFSRYFRRCPKNTDDWWSLSYPNVKFQYFINPCDVLLKMYVKVAWHTYSRNRLCLRGQRRNELFKINKGERQWALLYECAFVEVWSFTPGNNWVFFFF